MGQLGVLEAVIDHALLASIGNSKIHQPTTVDAPHRIVAARHYLRITIINEIDANMIYSTTCRQYRPWSGIVFRYDTKSLRGQPRS